MRQILEELYDDFGEIDVSLRCPEEHQRIKSRKGNLKKQLEKSQYRQVFRMLDDTDNETCKMSILNFASGVRFGLKFMTEVYTDIDNKIDF